MSSEVEKRLEYGRIGKPQIKKDELNKYMGNFRERVYLTMTVEQMRKEYYQKALIDRLDSGFSTTATLHIHAEIAKELQSIYTKIAKEKEIAFTFYSNNETIAPTTIGLVICSKEAVNIEHVDISEMYPNAESQFGNPKENETKKEGFFHKLFGK
ncbi:Uncharacterized protein YueI [Pilibacter termitis]|jgi:uncharacterized protein YueI|uniref:Uncharacterized protein YueI n=1 Tax=Pilibacter termitis TaxID=263852 RepID=A0A1T4R956_9ENTE|nr:DUF1694 domain-containing protein [Pilibacter termitis]SKA12455.1 Uncharacterized protein YueI [Pilibacter termitis]